MEGRSGVQGEPDILLKAGCDACRRGRGSGGNDWFSIGDC